jgi:Zn-dependent protease/CBS domain-containing protein
MFGKRLRLFKILGFEVRVDASWLLIAILVIWSLAVGVFPREFRGLPTGDYWWMGVAGAFGLFGSIVFHELCHSLVANHYQLPMRGITLFIFGGVAEMGGEPQSPKIEFLMAIAGPISSIVLGFICYGIGNAAVGHWPQPVSGVIAYLAWINWILAAFNLVPAFPLDGGRVLRSALWHFQGDLHRATRLASRIGSGFGILLILFAVYQLFYGYFVSAIWYFLIGMFIRGASRMSYEQLLLRDALQGQPIRNFMRPNPVTVPSGISIRKLVEDYFYRYHFRMFPVVADGDKLEGCVSAQDVKRIPREEWEQHHIEEIVRPPSNTNTIGPDADALNALAKMRESGASGLLVTDHEHLLAIISLKDLLKLLSTKLDLEGNRPGLPRLLHG